MGQVIYKERKNTNSTKWDDCLEKFGREDLLPLWVADMDFEAPACVKEALQKYLDQGVFGYYKHADGYEQAFMNWEASIISIRWKRTGSGLRRV